MKRMRRWTPASLALICAAALSIGIGSDFPAWAQSKSGQRVDLELVLAVDASGSVDTGRFNLQKRGYAAAFRSPQVLQAIRAGNFQSIAVAMAQWTGPELYIPVVQWTLIKDKDSAESFADAIIRSPRHLYGGGTSLSGAIDNSVALLSLSPYRGTKRVIDISGDGSNNSGRDVTMARDAAVNAGIGINGLPILTLEPDLDAYYRQYVIGGPGAFVIPAKNYDVFASAILRKLVAEISSRAAPHPELASR